MKYLFYILIPILLFSCGSNDDCNEEIDTTLFKRVHIQYSQYGNFKNVTYYENNKPVIDSSFYFDDDYPEMYQSKRNWQYNNNGLVEKTIYTSYQNEEYQFIEFSYDNQQRITLINNNDNYHSIFEYNDSQITKNHVHIPQGTDYIYTYEVNQNGKLISETNPNGMQVAQVVYNNNDMIEHSSPQVPGLHFSYLDYNIPAFMKHPEFGVTNNYILYRGGLNYNFLINTGDKFVNQISNDSINWTNLTFVYEFNEDGLPSYMRSQNNDYQYQETFFEYH